MLKKLLTVFIGSILVLSLFGCTHMVSSSKQKLAVVLKSLEEFKSADKGKILLKSETITQNKKYQKQQELIKSDTHLTFYKKDANTYYTYETNENNLGTVQKISIKKDENGLFQLNSKNKWELLPLDVDPDYYSSLIQMITLNFHEKDIDAIKITKKDSNRIYKITISPKALPKNMQLLSYQYCLDEDDKLNQVTIKQIGKMDKNSDDILTTTALFDFKY
jgi:hypothetical protein